MQAFQVDVDIADLFARYLSISSPTECMPNPDVEDPHTRPAPPTQPIAPEIDTAHTEHALTFGDSTTAPISATSSRKRDRSSEPHQSPRQHASSDPPLPHEQPPDQSQTTKRRRRRRRRGRKHSSAGAEAPENVEPQPSLEDPARAEDQKNKQKAQARSSRAQQRRDADAHPNKPFGGHITVLSENRLAEVQVIRADVDVSTLPTCKGAFTGSHYPRDPTDVWSLDRVRREGYKIIEWDGR